MAVPMASFAKGITFGGSKRRVASFRVAGGKRSTSDVSCCMFLRVALSRLCHVVTTCKSVAGMAFCEM